MQQRFIEHLLLEDLILHEGKVKQKKCDSPGSYEDEAGNGQ